MENTAENVRAQMRKGVLEYCILSILNKREAYASAIIEELKAVGMIVVQGLLEYRWEESTQGPPRKYYVISDKGREQLAQMDAAWDELVATIGTIKNA